MAFQQFGGPEEQFLLDDFAAGGEAFLDMVRDFPFLDGGEGDPLDPYANGKLCETVYPEGSYPAKWTKGQTVMIEFDPENPGLYVIKRTALRDLLPDILYWAGIGLVIAGAVLFLRFALR